LYTATFWIGVESIKLPKVRSDRLSPPVLVKTALTSVPLMDESSTERPVARLLNGTMGEAKTGTASAATKTVVENNMANVGINLLN
jgi:hypothetical protein